jgi:hypothetical protein
VRWRLSALVALAVAGCADSTSVPREASSPNPDGVSGTDPRALQRPANLRRALARVEKERQERLLARIDHRRSSNAARDLD